MFDPKLQKRRFSLLVATVLLVATRGIAAPVTLAEMENRYDPYFEARGPVKSITYTSSNVFAFVGPSELKISKVKYLPSGERWLIFDKYDGVVVPVLWQEKDNKEFKWSVYADNMGEIYDYSGSYTIDPSNHCLVNMTSSIGGYGLDEDGFSFLYNENFDLKGVTRIKRASYYESDLYQSTYYAVGNVVKDHYGNWISREFVAKNDTIAISRSIDYYNQDELSDLSMTFALEKMGIKENDSNDAFVVLCNAAILGDVDAQYALGCASMKYSTKNWLKKAAAEGHAGALYELGMDYYNGNGVEKDCMLACQLFLQAESQGCTKAQAMIGLCYYNGTDGIQQDYKTAVEWFKKSISGGDNEEALYYLGKCYQYGHGVAQSDSLAADCFYRCFDLGHGGEMGTDALNHAAELGHPGAQVEKGAYYGVPSDSALYWFKKAANQGSIDGQYHLGKYYEKVRDVEKMLEMYNAAANQGDVNSCVALARCYSEGLLVARNYNTAFKYAEKAWEINPTDASGVMAPFYENGIIVKRDTKKAGDLYYTAFFADQEIDLLLKSADCGNKEAIKELSDGFHYYFSDKQGSYDSIVENCASMGVASALEVLGSRSFGSDDYSEAIQWYSKALSQGSTDAWYYLALCCYNGYGIKQDYARAREMMEMYCKTTDNEYNRNEGYKLLAKIYENGHGTAVDVNKAIDCYVKAEEYGEAIRLGCTGEKCWKNLNCEQYSERGKSNISLCRKAAVRGDAAAMCQLGKCYLNGSGGLNDPGKGVEYLEKAAGKGHTEAQMVLGKTYFEGKFVPADYVRAAKFLANDKLHEDAEAMRMLAWCYEKGKGVEQDTAKAIRLYEKAAAYGDNHSRVVIADAYRDGTFGYKQDPEQAYAWSSAAMYSGELCPTSEACQNFARCYVEGIGVERDYGEAAKLYNMAFAEDSVRGQEERFNTLLLASQSDSAFRKDLALCYFYGRGTEQNYEEAARLLSAVIKDDDKNTIDNVYGYHEPLEDYYALGYCYYYGKGVEQDLPLAVSLLKKSNDDRAKDILGNSSHFTYREKDVTEESLQKLKIAAENGDVGAQVTVGKYYLLSGKSDNELEEAVKYLRRAAALGNDEAQPLLGCCYYYGKGVEQSVEKARSLYEVWKSRNFLVYNVSWSYVNLFLAEMGDDSAQCILAECLETGNGVDRDEAEAVKWYVKAARNGNEKAREKLTERGVEW